MQEKVTFFFYLSDVYLNFGKSISICFRHLGIVFRDIALSTDKKTYRCTDVMLGFLNEIQNLTSAAMHRCAATFPHMCLYFWIEHTVEMCQPAGNRVTVGELQRLKLRVEP